jgi:Holliday junction resolvase RusA-like endonuclease
VRIVIPMVPPSPNELRRRYRNPHVYKRLREAWERSLLYGVESAAAHQELVKQGQERVRVEFTIAHPKPYDPDNAIGCLKPVLDAMRKVGWIRDDSETWLELRTVRQQRSAADAPSTTIEIEPVA